MHHVGERDPLILGLSSPNPLLPRHTCFSSQPRVPSTTHTHTHDDHNGTLHNITSQNGSIITMQNGNIGSNTTTGVYRRHTKQNGNGVCHAENNGNTTWASLLNGNTTSGLKSESQGDSQTKERRPPLWRRPLGYCEKLMTSAHDYGCMTTVYALWLDSRKVIEFDLIKQASQVMYRKLPHLRMVVGQREGQLWWRETEDAVLDIDEVSSNNVEATLETLLRRGYRVHEGPLWFVRFLSHPSHSDTNHNHNNKYKYVCIFGFHHNVSDGTTNMLFCRVFLEVLNDLLQGNPVDLTEAGTFVAPLHDKMADATSSQWTLFCMFLRRFYRAVISYGAHVSNFTQVFRMPAEVGAGTRIVHHQLDEANSHRLYLRCKMEGVTINSIFTAAANLALYQLMAVRRPDLAATRINCVHAVNMRRYWPRALKPASLGCHISMLDVGFLVEERHLGEFWEYSRKIHTALNRHLGGTRRALAVQPISERMKLVVGTNYWLDRLGLPSTNDSHYCITNMGNLSATFPGSGPEVEVSRVLRTVSCHFMPTLCQHTLQTFRGRLSYSLDYYTQKLTRDTATQYAAGIMHILTSSIHTPN